jgi:hypothetical protein
MTPDILARLERLEAESAVRAVLARYMALCDTLDADTPMDELGGLFADDAEWVGAGTRHAAAFGAHRGRAAIVAMLDRYRGPTPHFAMNAHFLSSENITVTGGQARGGWMMLQTSTYADGSADLRAARLTVDFTRQDRWRIARFETQGIFSRRVDRWDDAAPLPVPEPPHD